MAQGGSVIGLLVVGNMIYKGLAPGGKVKAQGVAGSSPDDELWTPREQPSKRSSLARATNSGANLL